MKLFQASLLSLLVMSLAACHPNAGTSATASGGGSAPAADTVAVVNGTAISRNMYNIYVKAALQGKADPATLTQQQKDEALDNLVRAELVVQQAEKNGVDKEAATADMIELSRMNAIQQAFSDRFVKENKPTDAELHKEYDAQIAKLAHTEYHVEHILVPDADTATALITTLNKGGKFEDVAKKSSTDSSKNQGGDLGWMTPDRMVKPFADAMVALKPGEYTHVPVHTDYGWHVIKLLDTRPVAPPPFDGVKDQVSRIVLGNKFKAYVDGLLAKAQIDKKM
ncbi:MAG TPA: peptidylprolyl isomerase [Steroidobacteraceae bacterium]|nr:peptidylprolyl isomerase [Steroidobacteraceae bacterium]